MQDAYINVMNEIINPLKGWFVGNISDSKVDVYVEVLGEFNAKTLRRAMSILKREWTQQGLPQPAILLKHCQEAALVPDGDSVTNYGQPSNSKQCVSGCHHGVGLWSPEKRYDVYKWKLVNNINVTKNVVNYVKTYESNHGGVR